MDIEEVLEKKERCNNGTSQISGAEAVIRCLIREGVDLLFGYPGGAIMPIYDELYKYQDKVRHILARHEQGATHAAQGYTRASGKIGVVTATSGPGATNLITGIADAQIDSTAMLCITGQVSSHLLGTDAFQETDIIGISTPVTKWNYQITKASEIPEILARAFYIAQTGRPGPVLIDITKDAQFELCDFKPMTCTSVLGYTPEPPWDRSEIRKAAKLINTAKRPLIVWGQGILLGGAEPELRALAEKYGIPAAWTLLGASALPTSHPMNVGMVGMHGNYAPNMLTNECDVLIALGMRFDDRVTGNLETYAKQAKVIHFEIDPAEINKNVKAEVAVLGNVKETLQMLLPLLKNTAHQEWGERFGQQYQIEYDSIIQNDIRPKNGNLNMAEVIEEINTASEGNAVVVSDVGQHQMAASRYAKFNNTRSHITSGGLGTMGFALPAAIGAKMGVPGREVIAIIGDGGFQMTIQELGTIFQTKVPVKIVVLNNEFLGMVRQWQELFFEGRYASTEMANPDFTGIAKAYGIPARRITERAELASAVSEMMACQGPYFLEARVKKEQNIFPMIPTGASVSDIRLN